MDLPNLALMAKYLYRRLFTGRRGDPTTGFYTTTLSFWLMLALNSDGLSITQKRENPTENMPHRCLPVYQVSKIGQSDTKSWVPVDIRVKLILHCNRSIMAQTQPQHGHFTGHPLFFTSWFRTHSSFFIIMMSFHRKTSVHKHILNLLNKKRFHQ